MKKLLLFKFIALSLFTLVSVAKLNAQVATDLFISEYVEGSSNNKALEIFNGTGVAVDLSAYSLKQAYNGTGWNATDPAFTLILSGTLASGDVYVVANNAASLPGITSVADLKLDYGTAAGQKVVTFTGNDAVGLFKADVLIDVIGTPNAVPDAGATGWTVAGVALATIDHTLVRKASVTVGSIDWTASAGTTADNSQWIVKDKDVVDNLGLHTFGTTGLSKFSASKTIIYPNPATAYFNVKAPEGKYLVSINNSIGKLVKTSDLNSTGKIEISDLSSGLYFVTVENLNTKQKEVHKLMVK